MINTAIPTRFPIPFANAAGSGFTRAIPEASQVGIIDGAASLTTGFPPLCFQPEASGGVPPFGQDFNGLFKQITQWLQWQATGAPMLFDADFAAGIGGYPLGAELASSVTAGVFWRSTANNNLTDPDGGSAANWVQSGGGVLGLAGHRFNRDGTLEQWGGAVAGADGTTTIDLTVSPFVPFPNNCWNVVTSNNGVDPVAWSGATVINLHTIKIGQVSASSVPAPGAVCFWRAFGN